MKLRHWLACAALAFSATAHAETRELRIGVQFGTAMLPLMVMQHDHLIEQRLPDLTVTWRGFTGPGPVTDGMLSGALDIGVNGAPAILILWDKTRGRMKGIASVGGNPSTLVSRNPAVHSVKDFTDADRIAVPAVKLGLNAIILQMAAEQAFGPGQWERLDARTVTMGHADALTAMLSGASDINAHFSQPPYSTLEVKAGQREILKARDVLGDGWDMLLFTSQTFHDANPQIMAAVMDTLQQAMDRIHADPRAAARLYLEMSADHKSSEDEILALITDPDTDYARNPHSVMKFADFMHRIGTIKTAPKDWKDVFFPEAHALPGR